MGELSDVAKTKTSGTQLNVFMLKAKYKLFNVCLDKAFEYVYGKNPEVSSILSKITSGLSQIQGVSFDLLLNITEENQRQANDIQALKSLSKNENSEAGSKEKNDMIEMFIKEREELLSEITNLQEENKKYLETLIKRTKSSAEIVLQKPSPQACKLTKQELKDLINEIYISKAKYDLNQSEGSQRHTLEQHMYTYFSEKFQSRSKSIQKASEIVAGIRKYSDDIDVLLFAKILRSDCDENYRYLHEQVRETIAEMVKEHTKTEEIKTNN